MGLKNQKNVELFSNHAILINRSISEPLSMTDPNIKQTSSDFYFYS